MKLIISEDQKQVLIRQFLVESNFIDTDKDTGSVIGNLILKGIKNANKTSTEDTITSKQTPTSIGKISEKGKKLLENPIFKKKLQEISDSIKIDKNSIIKLMKHESGLDPSIKNSIGCVGLIQFCPSSGSIKTINGKQYTLEDLRNDLEVQMDAIKQFWLDGYKKGKIKKPADLYIYNFFPVAAGKSDDFILQTNKLSAEKIANSNPIFNRTLGRPKSTPLSVRDLNQYYQQTGMV
jgi:hypothetical protein